MDNQKLEEIGTILFKNLTIEERYYHPSIIGISESAKAILDWHNQQLQQEQTEKRSRKPFRHYFKLYNEVKEKLIRLEREYGGRFGIASSDKDSAKKWQGLQMRFEILSAYLEDRKPNWFNAYHLTSEEAQKRNKLYSPNHQ